MLPLEGAAICQLSKHIILVNYFSSVSVIQAFELVHYSDRFINCITEIVCFKCHLHCFSLSLEPTNPVVTSQTAVLVIKLIQ